MTQPGTIGTPVRPTRVTADELYLGTGSPYNTDVGSLLGVTFDVAETQDGTLVFDGVQGPFDGEVTIWVDGSQHPVTNVEYVDGGGVRRPVTQWHLGSRGEFLLTLDSLAFIQPATFDVSITGTNGPVEPGNTLDVTVDVSNSGGESATQTVTLDINNGVGQVDSTSVTLSGGGSTTQTLSWAVASGQTEQDYTATVASADDTASQTVTVSSGPSLVAKQDLVAWYPMEDGDGRDAANTTNFGDATAYDGTVNGAAHDPDGGVTDINAGASSGAFNFNSGSSDDRIDIGNIPSIEGVSQLTVCAWLNQTNSNNDTDPVGDFGGSFNNAITMSANNNGNLVYRVRKSGTRLNTSTTINRDGSYSHFAFVFDNGSIQGYKNGSPTGSNSGGPSTTPTVKMNLGGRFSSGNEYIGDIDDVRFYAAALSDSEINQIYTNTQP